MKTSAKGVNKRQNALTVKMYRDSIFGTESRTGRTFGFTDVKNIGFRAVDGMMFTYEQVKRGMGPIYLKREVLGNLYSTKTITDFT